MVTHGNRIKVSISKSIWDLGAVNRVSNSPALLAWTHRVWFFFLQRGFNLKQARRTVHHDLSAASKILNLQTFVVSILIFPDVMFYIEYCVTFLDCFLRANLNTANLKQEVSRIPHVCLFRQRSGFAFRQYINSVSTFEVLWWVWFRDAPPSSLQEVTNEFENSRVPASV